MSELNSTTREPMVPEFDAMSDEYYADPAGYFARFREDNPVFFYPWLNAWLITRREDVLTVLGDWTEYSNSGNTATIEVPEKWHHVFPPELAGKMIVGMDPEEHTKHRAVAQSGFTKARMEAIRPQIEERAHRILDRIEDRGSADLMNEYCLELTTQTLLAHLGLSWEYDTMMRELRGDMGRVLSSAQEKMPAEVFDEVWDRFATAFATLQDIVIERRNNPGEDFISEMAVHRNREGDFTLTPAEVALHICEMALAGADTTAQAMSNAVIYLSRQPEDIDEAIASPSLWLNVFEETIRMRPSATFASRKAMKDMEISGVNIAKGDMLWVVLASANTDPKYYERPFDFDIHRENPGDHLAFTKGRHTCLGQELARVQGSTGLKVLFERLPSLRPVVPIPMDFIRMALLPVRHSLPVTWNAGDVAEYKRHVKREMNLEVVALEQAAEGVIAITLKHSDGKALPAWSAGAHVDLTVQAKDGTEYLRQYSLSGSVKDIDSWRLGILREPAGRGGSQTIHEQLKVGSVIRVGSPLNHFELQPAGHYIFIAGGIGITPILPMIEAAETAGSTWELHYGGRTRNSMAFVDELSHFGESVKLYPQDEVGHPPLGEILSQERPNTLVYTCGPEPLLAAVEGNMGNWSEGSLHLERFAPKVIEITGADEAFEVEFALSGVTITVPPEKSILDVAEENGVVAISSCREGTCGTCETPILSGKADHRDSILSEGEQKANQTMMICVSRAERGCGKLVLDA